MSLHDRARVLRGRHLGRHDVHSVQRGGRDQLAGGRAPGVADRHLATAQSCTPSQRAGRQVRRGPAAAARQDRRARDPFHRHRPGSGRARRARRGVRSTRRPADYGPTTDRSTIWQQSDLEGLPEDQPGEHPDQGVSGDRIERLDLVQPAARRVSDAHPAEEVVPALRARGAEHRDRQGLRVREGALRRHVRRGRRARCGPSRRASSISCSSPTPRRSIRCTSIAPTTSRPTAAWRPTPSR